MIPPTAGPERRESPVEPVQLGSLRSRVMRQLSALLEGQARTHSFGDAIRDLTARAHADIVADLAAVAAAAADSGLRKSAIASSERCRRLENSLHLLDRVRRQHGQTDGACLESVLEEFDRAVELLASTLVERDLFERQSRVLEQIILSHERISLWKEFVRDILAGFHGIFPFDFFFVAFAEGGRLSLCVYHFGQCGDAALGAVKRRLIGTLLQQFKISADTAVAIEEYRVNGVNRAVAAEDIRLVCVALPDPAPKSAGVLGAAYASAAPLTVQEHSIIRSLLSVMVMVVGSSRVLGRTLRELEYHSGHDPLTGLYNRRYFTERLEYEIGRSERHRHEFSVLLIDLDNFKDINDSYGHPAGDRTLVDIARSIRLHVRSSDLATRIGDDEFAVILPETAGQGARQMAEQLRERLRGLRFEAPGGRAYRVTVSIGMVSYPRDGANAADLMAGVDVALHRVKRFGKDGVSVLESAEQRVRIIRDGRNHAEELRLALAEGQIVPYFQPIVDCRTGAVVANEALARRIKPDGEVVAAGAFIETIEKYGLGREMDKVVLGRALAALREYLRSGDSPPVRLFVNLSARELRGRGILGYAEELCARLELPPERVVFEIVERDAIGDMTRTRAFLVDLRRKGFAFALDDFGSGYNSFHYLRELYFEYVKIDGAFVRNILKSHIDRALVRNLGRLCRDLGIRTVAEFVESADILGALQDMGIDYVQGFHIGLPDRAISSARSVDWPGPAAPRR
jgi:diguanylate cyclase (GGDEF)-like protein